jgi:hypothetical protein
VPPRTRRVGPHDVKDPDSPGQVVAIISCPSEAFLPALLSASADEAFAPFFAPAAASAPAPTASPVLVAYHTTPAAVASTPAYAAWMQRFGPRTRHVMLAHVGAAAAAVEALLFASGMAAATAVFHTGPDQRIQLLKNHGTYQQDDREQRKAREGAQ